MAVGSRKPLIYLLDTHILVWWLLGIPRLSAAQQAAISTASATDPLRVSDISLWEISMLVSRGRIQLDLPLREWLERATAPPLVRTHRVTPAIAAEMALQPDSFHRDPADRILVATTRTVGATLVTSDKRIIKAGLVDTCR
jgi:PIN domain nuclease of toxin-antitoxin system